MKDDEVKVQFSISLTRIYSTNDIAEYAELNPLETDNLEIRLRQMIIEDVIDAINNGKGTFKITA